MQINYSSYVHVIEKGMNRRNMTGMAKVLFEFMCDHEDVVTGRITKKDLEQGIAHKRYIVPDKESIEWFRGQHDVAETLQKGAGNAAIIKDAPKYFDEHVIKGLINPQKLEIVINAMTELIESDILNYTKHRILISLISSNLTSTGSLPNPAPTSMSIQVPVLIILPSYSPPNENVGV